MNATVTAEQRAKWKAKYNAPCVLVDNDGPEWNFTLVAYGIEAGTVRAPIKQVWTADVHTFKRGRCTRCGEPQPRPPRYPVPGKSDTRRRRA